VIKYHDSLRGYAYEILKRDRFTCRYCGLDGKRSFDSWLTLSWDHLLPKNHPERDNPDYIVAACNFCNGADNHFFELAQKRGLSFGCLTQDQLVEQRKPYVLKTRESYFEFWVNDVVK